MATKLPPIMPSNPQIVIKEESTAKPNKIVKPKKKVERHLLQTPETRSRRPSKNDSSRSLNPASDMPHSMEHLGSFWENAEDIASEETIYERQKTRRKAVTTVEETGLTSSVLRNLATIFREADVSGKGALNLEQFKGVMRKTLTGDMDDDQLELMYMKTDTNCDGTVDWDEYLTFMLLECKGKDTMAIQAQRTFQETPKSFLSSEKAHKDSVVVILYQIIPTKTKEDSVRRYISIGKDGIVIFWNASTLQMARRFKVQSDNKMVWITDACLMPNSNILAIATTARTINFYDISASKFLEISRIIALEACPTCISYWSDDIRDNSVLLFGDDRGGVTLMIFYTCPLQTKISAKKMGVKKHVEKYHIASFIKNQIPMVRAVYLPYVHADLVRQIMYIPFLTSFVSCSKETETALCICNFDLQLQKRTIRTVRVRQGVNSFDYCQHLNMIVTGSYDALIRVWNPYILTRPSSIMYGHQSPVVFVRINSKREHVISISENKEVRIHDLNSQNCIQKFYKKSFPDMGTRHISACLFNPDRQDFVLATKYIVALESRENLYKDPHSMSQIDPIISAIFNPLFGQVVSACWDGTICTWDFKTGQKVLQFKACKVKHKPFDAEITALVFGPRCRRLLTSSRTGQLRIWNFNNGDLLKELPNIENMEITSLIWVKQRIITGGWSQRVVIYLEANDDDMISILNPYHKDDVMALSCYRSNILASACYNGDVYLWYMETGRLVFVLNANKNTKRPLSPREHTGKHVQNPSIYYSHNLEKNPHKLTELTPLPCYLRENQTVDLENALNPGSSKSQHGPQKKNSLASISRKSLKKRPSRYHSLLEIDSNKRKPTPSKRLETIEKMVFLENRENTASNAVLLTAGMNGIVNAWSIHSIGGLKGSFQASSEKNEPVTAMIYLKDIELLITGDKRGYIRVWDIHHYCIEDDKCTIECQMKWEHFTFVKFKRKLYGLGKYHLKFPYLKMDTPHLISAFRGHLRSVTWLENVPNVKRQEMFLSSSLDCSIRLWGLDGEFYGIFNQTESWNLADVELPHWRDGQYTDFENTNRNSIQRNKKLAFPKDIKKVASATTLVVLAAGRIDNWAKIRNVLHMVLKLKRRQKITSAFRPTEEFKKEAGLTFLTPETPLYDLDIPALLAEAERKKNNVERNKILGVTYRKRINHRPLPKLKMPLAMVPQCAVYRALPYFELEDVSEPAIVPEIKAIRKHHCLPPINKDLSSRPRTMQQSGRNTTLMGHLNQQLRRSIFHARQSIDIRNKRRKSSVAGASYAGTSSVVKTGPGKLYDSLPIENEESNGISASSSRHDVNEPISVSPVVVDAQRKHSTNNTPHNLDSLAEEEEG